MHIYLGQKGGEHSEDGSSHGGMQGQSARREDVLLESAQGQPEIGNSRLSPGHIYRLMQTFSQLKRDLVTAIGFGGMLCIPNLTKLNLKFSLWLLNQVYVETQTIVLDDSHMIRFFDEDVEKVFGIPCGPRKVDGRDAHVSPESVAFMRSSLGLVDKEPHSLKRVESVLAKELTESSSRLEQECFQIAFVIYVMGHLLAPSLKHDYVSVDYWGALKNADHIIHYNWCNYVVRAVLDAAIKVQSGWHGKGPMTIPGCHLFLQVFYLDNMDLGCYTLPHKVFPRIKEFNSERMRVMIRQSVHSGGPDDICAFAMPRIAESVCYQRRYIERSMSSGEVAKQNWRAASTIPSTSSAHNVEEQQKAGDCTPGVETTPPNKSVPEVVDIGRFLNPGGFYEYLKLKYPDIIGCDVLDLMKRHNAKCVKHYTEHHTMARTYCKHCEDSCDICNEVIPWESSPRCWFGGSETPI
ncbi:hypothetical protein C2845_PM09G02040 [Panicum miliaceum]|uniref:Aminotransferase-like plant mobile domain-containing protein n=1 Tax=Panicum miliaceum TaxID=4540 RepID=A0A3L6S042_PANMI|nr:hypothetical protein C2845_PM09G02040 [Panicum miliaceum]